ncbi:MAG: YHS domain-containing (seleno)protein [Albidovulum sp.]
MSLTRRAALLLLALAIPVAGTILRPAVAAESEIYAPGGVAIDGYDVVAYFTQGRPIPGQPGHAIKWHGAMWYFSTAEALEMFEMNPMAYVPRYGGYCAYAMAKGALSPTDPAAFTIYDGHLYLTFNPEVRTIWSGDVSGNIERADAFWSAAAVRH